MPRPALLLLLAVVLVPACGWRSEPVAERADTYPVDVQDAIGAVVTLPAKPERIVSLTEDGTATLEALGYDGEVVTLAPDVEARRIAEEEPDLVLTPIDIADDRYERIQEVAGAPIFRYGAATYADGPRVFAIVKVDGLRIFTILTDTDPARVRIGDRVRLAPLRVADDPKGQARWLPAFAVVT